MNTTPETSDSKAIDDMYADALNSFQKGDLNRVLIHWADDETLPICGRMVPSCHHW